MGDWTFPPKMGLQVFSASLAFCVMLACGGAVKHTETDTPASDRGSLTVTLEGLPSQAAGDVQITGPSSYSAALQTSGVLSGLLPGSYQVAARGVLVSGTSYAPSPITQTLSVAAGGLVLVTVSYAAQAQVTGALTLSVTGLPAGAAASISISGPAGYTHTSLGSGTLSGLVPGTYVISAPAIQSGSLSYGATPANQAAEVIAGQTRSLAIAYAATVGLKGTLAITLSGLPNGIAGKATVSGPGGFNQIVSSSQTLPALDPGAYSLSADPVNAAGRNFAPQPNFQSTTVLAGATTAATITYAPPQPVVTGVTPPIAVLNQASTFTVAGQNLPAGLTMAIANADGYIKLSATTFSLTPRQTGIQTCVVKDAPGGNILFTGPITVSLGTGSLSVSILGAPVGGYGNVNLTGPNGFYCNLGSTQFLTGLEPGPYALSAQSVLYGGATYLPQPTTQSATVQAGMASYATVSYTLQVNPVVTGVSPLITTLNVATTFTVSGQNLPSTLAMAISNADGYLKLSGTSFSLTPRQPGTQTCTVKDALGGNVLFTVPITVNQGTGILSVTLLGAPSGGSGNVNLTGPNGFYRNLGASQNLSGLEPGSYTLSAQAVVYGGTTYLPQPTSQSVTVQVGMTSYATVTYTASQPQVTGVTPLNATFNQATTFTVAGQNLPSTLAMAITNADSYQKMSADSFSLTPRQAGPQTCAVKDAPGGNVLFTTTVQVAQGASGLDLVIDQVHITQATQTYGGTVPLVAGRRGFIRVFVKANQANSAQPRVRVRFTNGSTVNELLIPAPRSSVPTNVDEGDLGSSWNSAVDLTWIQPGLQVQATVDPDSTIQETNKSNNDWPGSGPASMNVRTLPKFQTTLIPVIQNGLTGDVNTTNRASYLTTLAEVWPISEIINVGVHGSYTTTQVLGGDTGWSALLAEIEALRIAEGNQRQRHYYGVVRINYTDGNLGLGYVPPDASDGRYRSAIGWDSATAGGRISRANVFAHETGHNFGRYHSPCGNPAQLDPNYPYGGAGIGVYGYDLFHNVLFSPTVSPANTDIMGYCENQWVSDYTYRNVLAFREASPTPTLAAMSEEEAVPCLLVWGRVLPGGEVELEPAFQVTTLPEIPEGQGSYRLEALDQEGNRVFSYQFSPVKLGCSLDLDEGGFAFAVPVSGPDAQRLGRLRVSDVHGLRTERVASAIQEPSSIQAPRIQAVIQESATTLIWAGERYPCLMVRDAGTGEIRAMLRGGAASLPMSLRGFDILASDGLRSFRIPLEN